VLFVVILGLFAAFLFATSASMQQRAAHLAAAEPHPDGGDGPVGQITRALPLLLFLRKLVRNPIWLFGWVTNLVGFMFQGAALHLGSVALVQPLIATQLLFALPLGSIWSRCRPTRRDWLAATAIVGGIAVFLAVRGAAPLEGSPDRPKVVIAALSAAILVGLLVAAAAGRRPPVHAALVAVAAGLCFAISAVLMKLTAEDLVQRGVAATARDWVGYALAISTLTGLLLGQEAFAAGSLPTAVSAMTITNPLASYLVGVLAFDVAPPTSPGTLAAVAGAGLLLLVGTIGLAHSPTVQRELAQDAKRQAEVRAQVARSSWHADPARSDAS
jgi:drug/metabolite transporter (DMT)-like permease